MWRFALLALLSDSCLLEFSARVPDDCVAMTVNSNNKKTKMKQENKKEKKEIRNRRMRRRRTKERKR